MKEPERWFSVKTALWNAAGVKSTNWVSAFLGGAQIRATQRGPVHALWAVILGRTPSITTLSAKGRRRALRGTRNMHRNRSR
jgi:hypothetical protein